MSRFKFVIVSKDEAFKMYYAQFSIDHIRPVEVSFVPNNTDALAKVYNKYLDDLRSQSSDKTADFIVFIHADVAFCIDDLLLHIERCKDKYDVMGLCGTSIVNVSQSPLNWWTASNPTPNAKWGCVTHGELGNQKSFFSQHSPLVTDHEVACIDGLCIIFGPKAIASGIRFDEQFTFDFYDTDISFQAILKYGLTVGVLVEQSLSHYSVGKSILTADFLKHEIDFRKKWNLEIPEKSPIQVMLKRHE